MSKKTATKKVEATKETKEEVKQVQISAADDKKVRAMPTKSEQIRYCDSLGMPRSAIAKYLSEVHGKTVIYQHVRNVLVTPIKRPAKDA